MKALGTIQLLLYAVIALVVGYVVYRVFKLGDSVKDAAISAYNWVGDVGGGVVDDVVAGHAAVVTAIAAPFKSEAEQTVDDLYGPSQGWKTTTRPKGKTVVTPIRGNDPPKNFSNPDVYTSVQLTNSPPPNDPSLAPITLCDILGTCGNYSRSNAPLGGTLEPGSNRPPQNNNTNFVITDDYGRVLN